MYRVYETIVAPNGVHLSSETHILNSEANYEVMLQSSGMINLEGNRVMYSTQPLYLDYEQQKSIVFHIVNANNLSTYHQFWNCTKEHYKEYLNVISNNAVIDMLKWMYHARLNDERVYPQVKLPVLVLGNK